MNEKEIILDPALFEKEAEEVLQLLNQSFENYGLANLGSRGALLTNAIGELNGFLTATKATGTLQEKVVWVVNMFDQADTGGAIMMKPGGRELRADIEKLRKALNQQGKITILSGKDIEEVLEDRKTSKNY